MQISKFSFAWACLVWEGMVLRDIWTGGPDPPRASEDTGALAPRLHCMCRSQEATVHHQSYFQNSRVDRGGAMGQEDPCAEMWERPLLMFGQPTDPAVQPLQGVLTSLVLSMGTSSRGSTSNRSGQFATNSLGGDQGTLVFYKFLIFFFKQGLIPRPFFCGTLASNLYQESLCLHEMTI